MSLEKDETLDILGSGMSGEGEGGVWFVAGDESLEEAVSDVGSDDAGFDLSKEEG